MHLWWCHAAQNEGLGLEWDLLCCRNKRAWHWLCKDRNITDTADNEGKPGGGMNVVSVVFNTDMASQNIFAWVLFGVEFLRRRSDLHHSPYSGSSLIWVKSAWSSCLRHLWEQNLRSQSREDQGWPVPGVVLLLTCRLMRLGVLSPLRLSLIWPKMSCVYVFDI